MRRIILGICLMVVAGALTSCSFGSSPTPVANLVVRAPTRVPSPTRITRATPIVPTTPGVATPSISTTPSVILSPTITPTPGPPTATFTPAPGEQTLEAAENVDQALVAFAQAQASGDTQALLQAQQKLLDAANAAASVAALDQTDYGHKLQSALDAVQGASTGNFDKLNDAHRTLLQIEGSAATPVVLPRPMATTQQSLSDVAQNLRGAVQQYSQALSNGNRDDLLTAQRNLLAAIASAEAATKNVHSPAAQQIQAALTAIHDGLAGDTGKFGDAANALANLPSQAGSTATPSPSATPSPTFTPTPSATATPSSTATPSPTSSANTTATSTPASQHVDLQPLQNAVDNSLQALQNEVNDPNKENVQRAENDLQQAIQRAFDALADDHSPAADRFRSALSTAQNAASGDFSKIQQARDQLKAALGS